MKKDIQGKLSDFNYRLAVEYRHERDYWKQQAEHQQARAVIYKTLFAIVTGFVLAVWVL